MLPVADPSDRTLKSRVGERLQRKILSGALRPGDRIRQVELAREFGVAQSVVRESLLELHHCGLSNAIDGVGVFVTDLDPRMILEAYEVREVFEGLAARLCCAHASRHDLQRLRALARDIHGCTHTDDLERMGRLDREFHRTTIRICGNPLLQRLTKGSRAIEMIVRANRDPDLVLTEHEAIVDAVAAGDEERAERLARGHVAAARAALQAQADRGTFEPCWITPDSDAEELL